MNRTAVPLGIGLMPTGIFLAPSRYFEAWNP
jgi:hypothetical protein